MKGKYYCIQGKESGLVLDIKDGDASHGTKVILWEKNYQDNQLWCDDRSTLSIRSKLDDDLCLTVNDDNELVVKRFDRDDKNQRWVFMKRREIICNGDERERVLDVLDNSTEAGSGLGAWEDNGGDNQRFECQPIDAKYFWIVSSANSKYCLDVKKASEEPGAQVILYKRNDEARDNQLWFENEDGAICSKLNGYAITCPEGDPGESIRINPYDDDNKWHQWVVRGDYIRNARHRQFVIDIYKGDVENNQKIIFWEEKGAENQKWKILHC